MKGEEINDCICWSETRCPLLHRLYPSFSRNAKGITESHEAYEP